MKRSVILSLFIPFILTGQNKQTEQAVTKLFNQYLTVANIPGLSVCVSLNDKIVYKNSFGFSDLNNKIPANDSSLYRIGSITKLFTATAFVKLIESGALKELDYISRYVDVPKKMQVIKLGQLAANTSGIRHYGSHEISSQNEATHKKLETALSHFINDSLLCYPGDKYIYSSYGYILLGAAIENQQQKNFNKVIDSLIIRSVGLNHTCPEILNQKIPAKSMFYYPSKTGFSFASGEDNSYKWPAGGYLSTPSDLVKLSNELLSGKIISKENLSFMLNSQKTSDDKETGSGYSLKIGKDNKGRKVVFIAGEPEGARAFLLIYPDEKLVISVCANVYKAPISEGEMETIAGYFLNDYLIEKNLLPSKPFKFMTRNDGRDIEGDLIVDGKKGVIIGLIRGEVPILDIVKDKNEIRIIALSNSGIINIWLTPEKEGYLGKWGHEKPLIDFKML